MKKSPYLLEIHFQPGLWLEGVLLDGLVYELRETALTCFDSLPDYQCLRGNRSDLSDKVIAVARRPGGEMAGFCSMVMINVPGVGEVLHTGLTCVRPERRKGGLTHQLSSAAIVSYLLKRRPLGSVFLTNVACVLSSLGNIALHADHVFPSPFTPKPSAKQLLIGYHFDRFCRDQFFIKPEAVFDPERFVFQGSVPGTVFQKQRSDARFHHRVRAVNDFYLRLMDFERGDEVLQVGQVSLLTSLRHHYRKAASHRPLLPRRLSLPGPIDFPPSMA